MNRITATLSTWDEILNHLVSPAVADDTGIADTIDTFLESVEEDQSEDPDAEITSPPFNDSDTAYLLAVAQTLDLTLTTSD